MYYNGLRVFYSERSQSMDVKLNVSEMVFYFETFKPTPKAH